MRTPKPAGPGLPRAPPSMYATISVGSSSSREEVASRGRCGRVGYRRPARSSRMRLQLSHWMICSLRRTVLKTCGRSRTWQIVQMPSRASATATPFRRRDTSSKIAQHLRIERRDDHAARSARRRSSDAFSSACSARQRLLVGVHRLLFGGERASPRASRSPSDRRPRASARGSCLRAS